MRRFAQATDPFALRTIRLLRKLLSEADALADKSARHVHIDFAAVQNWVSKSSRPYSVLRTRADIPCYHLISQTTHIACLIGYCIP